ncbi:MAG: TIGR03118 family protein, partial [Terriglobales bacterium]
MSRSRNWKHAAGVAALTLTFLLLAASNGLAQHYQRTDLTTDNSNTSPTAPNVDPNLVNAWGMSRSSGSPWWISDNGTSLSTLYDSTGLPKSLVVSIPLPDGQPGGTPTGTVFNYTGAFEVGPGQSAVFLFATEDGTISGWNPGANGTAAIVKVNHSGQAIYKGLALATAASGPRLYATNFQSGGVEVFDGHFHHINVAGGFLDANLPPNYAPFGIQNVGGNIVVTFAHRKPGSKDEDHGAGMGYVDVFDLAGKLVLRLQHGPFLNAPWGIAQAPGDFG